MTPGELERDLGLLVGVAQRVSGPEANLPYMAGALRLQRALEVLADVRTLDGWAKEGKFRAVHSYAWGAGGTSRIVLEDGESPVADSLNHYRGATLDEARAKAAAWVRGLK